MDEKNLQTSKKRLSTNKWSYRNCIIEKNSENCWYIVKRDSDSESLTSIKPEKNIKDICYQIDLVLGELPKNKSKQKQQKKTISYLEDPTELYVRSKNIAYEFRWELENELYNETKNDELKNKMALPFGQGKKIGTNGFLLAWNKKFNIFDTVVNKMKEKYSTGVEIIPNVTDDKSEIKVLIKK